MKNNKSVLSHMQIQICACICQLFLVTLNSRGYQRERLSREDLYFDKIIINVSHNFGYNLIVRDRKKMTY
jgi:hypothetical protein